MHFAWYISNYDNYITNYNFLQVSLIVDTLYDIPCKIIHVRSGSDLEQHKEEIVSHFKNKGSPIMMGGDTDASSKGIMGICYSSKETYLLVVVCDL